MPANEPSPTPWPITGTLDLHLFQPKEVDDLVPTYLDECRKRGILQVRIIHGKGTGALRAGIQDYLRTNKRVKSFRLGNYGEGDAGVTVVTLKDTKQ